jgi:GNAT superfamily N-acetyltransferase
VTLHIRSARRDDAALICRFICDLAEYERLRHEVKATPEMIGAQLFGARAAAEVIIGEIEGQPRGFALFFSTFSTFEAKPGFWLEDLFVEPDARGSGLGKALLAHLASLAVERGCARLEWSVLDWNAPSIAFYRALGAKPMDEWTTQRLSGEALEALAAQTLRG